MKQQLFILTLISLLFGEPISDILHRQYMFCAENSGLGETGVAFSSTLGSTLLNPANGVLYSNEQDISLSITSGVGRYNDSTNGNNGVNSLIGYFPTFVNPNIRMGIVLSNKGHILSIDEDFKVTDIINEYTIGKHDVDHKTRTSSASVSLAWKEYLSLGLGIRFLEINSKWETQIDSSFSFLLKTNHIHFTEEAKALLLDMGLRLQYPLYFENSFFIRPSIGFSALSLGKDSIQTTLKAPESSESMNELPSSLLFGSSLTLGVENSVWGTFLFDSHREKLEKDIVSRSIGLQIGLTPLLQLNGGYLNDTDSLRRELHLGATIGYRSLQMKKFLESKGKKVPNTSNLHNIQMLYSFSTIKNLNEDNLLREGQHFHQISCAVAFNKRKEVALLNKSQRKIIHRNEVAISTYEEVELELVE